MEFVWGRRASTQPWDLHGEIERQRNCPNDSPGNNSVAVRPLETKGQGSPQCRRALAMLRYAILLMTVGLCLTGSSAASRGVVPYQGSLKKAGQPYTGSAEMKF